MVKCPECEGYGRILSDGVLSDGCGFRMCPRCDGCGHLFVKEGQKVGTKILYSELNADRAFIEKREQLNNGYDENGNEVVYSVSGGSNRLGLPVYKVEKATEAKDD